MVTTRNSIVFCSNDREHHSEKTVRCLRIDGDNANGTCRKCYMKRLCSFSLKTANTRAHECFRGYCGRRHTETLPRHPGEKAFDQVGLGEDGAMLFSATKNFQLLKNRELMRRLLVTEKRKFTIAQVVDIIARMMSKRNLRSLRVRPAKADVEEVICAAFNLY